jgi:hypothetical protein
VLRPVPRGAGCFFCAPLLRRKPVLSSGLLSELRASAKVGSVVFAPRASGAVGLPEAPELSDRAEGGEGADGA